jgi:hypothetical protein
MGGDTLRTVLRSVIASLLATAMLTISCSGTNPQSRCERALSAGELPIKAAKPNYVVPAADRWSCSWVSGQGERVTLIVRDFPTGGEARIFVAQDQARYPGAIVKADGYASTNGSHGSAAVVAIGTHGISVDVVGVVLSADDTLALARKAAQRVESD